MLGSEESLLLWSSAVAALFDDSDLHHASAMDYQLRGEGQAEVQRGHWPGSGSWYADSHSF